MKHPEYSVNELIEDSSFRHMAMGTASAEEVEKWSQWIEYNERNRLKAREAYSIITGFTFVEPPNSDINEEWGRLYNSTLGESNTHSNLKKPKKEGNDLLWLYRIAAVFLMVGLVGLGLYFYDVGSQSNNQVEQITSRETISTGDQEQKILQFSNGAKIVLNRNSSLIYTDGLKGNETMDVILDGEAFFDVEADAERKNPAFSVRTPDGIVRDIGTKFLVTVENNRSRVVLNEGLVEVEPIGGQESFKKFKVTRDESVEFNKENILSRNKVNSTFYTSWATGFMQFDETSINELAKYIEQRFNVEVQVNGQSMDGTTLEGAIHFQSLEELVRSISEVTGIEVYQSENGSTVYIGNR